MMGLRGLREVLGILLGIMCLTPVMVGTRVAWAQGESIVTVKAVIEPLRWRELQFLSGGRVAEVIVAEGDIVAAGDVLARLDDRQAALAVQEAEAAVATAQVALTELQAGPRIQEVTAASAARDAAQSDLAQAIALRDQLAAGSGDVAISAAQAQPDAALAERRAAQQELTWANEGHDEERKRVAREQMHVAELKVQAAEAQVTAAPVASAAELREANASVWAAQAQVAIAEARLARLQAGARAQEIVIAETEVQRADVTLALAKRALERYTLRAPFAGTVAQVTLKPGQSVVPGVGGITLATSDQWQIKTTDLTELDVICVTEGQTLDVTIPALPGVMLTGTVRSIALEPMTYHSDVVYTAVLDINEAFNVQLRWGMTAEVLLVRP